MNKKKIFAWEILGFIFISLLGSFLHFVFDLLGRWPPVALVAAVNESVWEHLKLAFWPALLYAVVEWPFFRRKVDHFWAAKAAGILVMPLSIVLLFYGYTALSGGNVLWADISLFFLAVLIGQTLSFRLMLVRPSGSRAKIPAVILLILMISAFSLLTFFPPKCPLFRDSRTDQYGLGR
jgi:hypothetical protein